MKTNIKKITTEITDINHIATTIWFSGCKIMCNGCQNEELEFFENGYSIAELEKELKERRKFTEWLVYLGGNPLDSIDVVLEVSRIAKELNFKQFLYSGYSFEEFQGLFDTKTHKILLDRFKYIKTGKFDLNYHKNCGSYGQDYFFSTLNQEIYESQEESWRKFYSFNLTENEIIGNLSLI